jgi:hypothetical protein
MIEKRFGFPVERNSIATVTICAPDAMCAAFISSNERYFPVPMMRRDVNVFPANSKTSDIFEFDFHAKAAG